MGLVQSQPPTSGEPIAVEGFFFTLEKQLHRLIPIYGNLIVDFKKTFLGAGFTVTFSRQGSC